jgi:hypothetical protein
MIKLVKALRAKALPDHRLDLVFSDGSAGVLDLKPFVFAEGEVNRPLRDPSYFARVFVEMGVPTWPNGCDVDPTAARMELESAGALTPQTGRA